jgi:hypothetical protein
MNSRMMESRSPESAKGRKMPMKRLVALSLAGGLICLTIGLGPKQAAAQGSEEVDLSKLPTLQADLDAAKAEDASLIAAISKGVQDSTVLIEKHKALVEQLTALKPEVEALKSALAQQRDEAEKQRADTV